MKIFEQVVCYAFKTHNRFRKLCFCECRGIRTHRQLTVKEIENRRQLTAEEIGNWKQLTVEGSFGHLLVCLSLIKCVNNNFPQLMGHSYVRPMI